MKNKLGINSCALEKIEYELINTKLKMLDDRYTFNNQSFDLNYLNDLNEYLFCDIYDKTNLGFRNSIDDEKYLINCYLVKIIEICINNSDNISEILNLIQNIWTLQPFIIGNTRTLIAFLKVLKEAFVLNIEINLDEYIDSKPSMFYKITTVNQKRLTK